MNVKSKDRDRPPFTADVVTLRRYQIVSAYIGNQTDEEWIRLVSRILADSGALRDVIAKGKAERPSS